MSKEKQTFAWDTTLTVNLLTGKTYVQGTDIEVSWDSIMKIYWEI